MTVTALRLTIRQAGPADAPVVSSILLEAAEWLRSSGIAMWKDGELTEDAIALDVAAGAFFVATHDDEVVGTIRFQLSDPRFWPDAIDGEAVYVHRLAVRRAFAGGVVAGPLLQWAADRGRTLDRRYLRLDCEASRARLRATYEGRGFRFHSERHVAPYTVARYELELRQSASEPPPAPIAD